MDNSVKSILLAPFNLLYRLSPELDLKLLFRLKQGYRLNLKQPRTYSEKLQWIKLYDRNPLMPKCCDKFAVRDYVKDCGCGELLNPLIWEGFDPADIPFDALPKKCAIKATHGSTFNILCQDTSKLDRAETVEKCREWLRARYLPCYGEWFYGVERPRIIVEEYIETDDPAGLRDYKIYCFNGVPKMVALHSGRFGDHRKDLYDRDWHYLRDKSIAYPPSGVPVEKPAVWDQVLRYAERLSAPFLHARVDFYIVGDRIIFGEITFTPGSGFDRFCSYDFDLETGRLLSLGRAHVHQDADQAE